MKFYVHAGSVFNKYQRTGLVWEDLKTRGGAIRRARRIFKGKPFSLYIFTDFYAPDDYKCILKGAVFAKDAPDFDPLKQYHTAPTVPGGSHGEVYDTRVYNHATGKYE